MFNETAQNSSDANDFTAQHVAANQRDNHRHDLRELSCYFDDDGFLVLKGRFTPEQGAVIRQALEVVMEQLYEEHKNVSAETSEFEKPDPVKQQPEPCRLLSAEPCKGETKAVASPAAAAIALWMRTTLCIGLMGAKPVWITWFFCVGIITVWCMKEGLAFGRCPVASSNLPIQTGYAFPMRPNYVSAETLLS